MVEFLLTLVGIISSWHCYRLGYTDGNVQGFDEGRTKGLLEGSSLK